MQSNPNKESTCPETSAYGGSKRGGWCDDGAMRKYWRIPSKGKKPKYKNKKRQSIKTKEKESNND